MPELRACTRKERVEELGEGGESPTYVAFGGEPLVMKSVLHPQASGKAMDHRTSSKFVAVVWRSFGVAVFVRRRCLATAEPSPPALFDRLQLALDRLALCESLASDVLLNRTDRLKSLSRHRSDR
jgi:hypothetical protein